MSQNISTQREVRQASIQKQALLDKLIEEEEKLSQLWVLKLERDFEIMPPDGHGRTTLEDTSEWLKMVKETLLHGDTIHPIAIMEFLKFYSELHDLCKGGKYSRITKAISLVYQLKVGCGMNKLKIPASSYREHYIEFWEGYANEIHNWCDEWMEIFSNVTVRVLYAKLNNPERFSHVTLFVDGKDFLAKLSNLKSEKKLNPSSNKSNLLSHKLSFSKF
jgi:hypothetical protein